MLPPPFHPRFALWAHKDLQRHTIPKLLRPFVPRHSDSAALLTLTAYQRFLPVILASKDKTHVACTHPHYTELQRLHRKEKTDVNKKTFTAKCAIRGA